MDGEGFPDLYLYVTTGEIRHGLSHLAFDDQIKNAERQVMWMEQRLQDAGASLLIRDRITTKQALFQEILDLANGILNPALLANGQVVQSALIASTIPCRSCGLPLEKKAAYERANCCSECFRRWTSPPEDPLDRERRLMEDEIRDTLEPNALDERVFNPEGAARA